MLENNTTCTSSCWECYETFKHQTIIAYLDEERDEVLRFLWKPLVQYDLVADLQNDVASVKLRELCQTSPWLLLSEQIRSDTERCGDSTLQFF